MVIRLKVIYIQFTDVYPEYDYTILSFPKTFLIKKIEVFVKTDILLMG